MNTNLSPLSSADLPTEDDLAEAYARRFAGGRRTAAELLQCHREAIARIQANTLREAAADNETGWALRSWLNARADSIEQEAASGV